MGYCRVRITGTRVKANILSGMATTYSGPEEASNTAQAGTSAPSSVRSASVARIFSPIQNTIIMASAEPIVENRRWAVNHQSRGVCCGCCGCSGTCGCCAGGIGLLILIPHSYWPQTDRSHVQYSSRIRHGVSIALGMGEEIINGQGMINVNQSPCRESPLLCGIVVGRHAILPDFFAAAHTTPHMTDDAARRNGVIATIPQYILWDGTNVHRLTFMPSRTGVGRHAIIAQKSPPSHTHHCR